MINADIKDKLRHGLQGNLSFEHTNPNANPSVFKDVKDIVRGIHGFEGAGGTRAQLINKGNTYSESQVFKNKKDRDAVQQRLDMQVTEKLNSLYGKSASAAKMSVPAYLQSQGVGGIREIGEGADKRMSAYTPSNFRQVSFNPLVGSNERSSQAMIKQSGHGYTMSGGMGENKRLNTIVSPAVAKELGERTRQTQLGLETGMINMGDLEGSSVSRADRMEIKHKKRTVQNAVMAGSLYSENPVIIEKVRSELLQKEQMKKVVAAQRKTMQDEGLLDPDPEKKEREDKSGSGKGVMAKGAAALMSGTQSIVSKISSMVSNMLNILTKISMDMGKLIKDSAEVGIDVNTADTMRKWGIGNPSFSGGNEFILMDAVKAFNAKAGDITRVGGVDFDNMAYQGYGHLIKGVVQSSVNQTPLEGTKAIYNSMAQSYMNAGSDENKRLELKKQISALSTAFSSDFSAGYSAMLQASEKQGLINKNNAGNMWDINMDQKNIDGLKSIGGSNVNEFIPGAAGAMDLAGNTKMLNDVLGDIGKIQNALYMMLLSNMDLIIQILLGIAKGLLGMAAKLDVNGAAEGLARLEKAEAGMAKKGQINLDSNVAKAEISAKAEIRNNLSKKGVQGKELDDMTEAAFLGGSKGDLSNIPEKYRGAVTGSVATKLAVYNTGKKKSKEGYNDTMHGSFWTSGLLGNLFQDSASEQKDLLSKLGLGEYNATQDDVGNIEGAKISGNRKKNIISNAYGVGATKEDSISDTKRFAIALLTGKVIAQKLKYSTNLYPEETKPTVSPVLSFGAESDLGGLPFFPSAKADSSAKGNFSPVDFAAKAEEVTEGIKGFWPSVMKPKKKKDGVTVPDYSYSKYSDLSSKLISTKAASESAAGAEDKAQFEATLNIKLSNEKGLIAANTLSLSDQMKKTDYYLDAKNSVKG